MKEKIKHNFGLKVLSLVLAFVLWIVIINAIDPSDSRIISNIPVVLLHQESLTDLGYTFEVLEGGSVSITVKGPKSILDSLSVSDFYASADLSTISQWSDYVYVDIDVKCVKNVSEVHNISITLRNEAVKINIENRDKATMNVQVDVIGEPASGYVVGDCNVSPMSITVSGAASTVEQIAKIVAECDVEGATMDMTEVVDLKVYNEDDELIDLSNLVLSKTTAKVRIPILLKKTVPVHFAYKGSPKDGYKVASLESNIKEVVIAGSATVLAGINEIDLPADLIDIADLAASKDFTIRISHYIPSTVKVLSETTANVKAVIEPVVTKDFTIPSSQITIENKNVNFNYAFLKTNYNITVTGVSSEIEKVLASNLTATVDVAGLTAGSHVVKLNIQNPNNCTVSGDYSVTVVITK